jgi:hypothetical protein
LAKLTTVMRTRSSIFVTARTDARAVNGLTDSLERGRMARDLGPGHRIVTILCDYGTRYQSKLFNPDFLRSKGLEVPEWMETRRDIKTVFEPV